MLTTIAALALLAQAQPKPPPQEPPAAPEKPKTTVTAGFTYGHRFETDLDGASGEVEVQAYKASVDVIHQAAPTDFVRFNGWLEHARYDWSDDASLLPGVSDMFDDVRTIRVEGVYTHVYGEHWSGLAYGALSASFEEDATIGDALAVGFGLGPIYRTGPDLSIGLLLRFESRIEDDPYVFPHPLIEWKINERLTLKNEVKAGTGYLLAYSLDEAQAAAFETRAYYTLRRFRLDSGAPPSEGVVQEDRVTWDVGLRYQGHANLAAAIHFGFVLWQEFTIEDKDGSKLEDVETDIAPVLTLVLSWTF